MKWTRTSVWDMVLDRLREFARVVAGTQPDPTAAVMDSQFVKMTGHGEEHGFDGGKPVKGRKCHLWLIG